jgi:polysaccharide export outer membrane protein
MRISKYIKYIIITLIGAAMLSSCRTRNLFINKEYKHSPVDSTLFILPPNYEHVIAPDDKVSVSIWNHDDLSVGSLFSIYNANEVYGRWILVDIDGYIELPELGKTKLGGLTVTQAEKKLSIMFSEYILKPVIVVKVMNREITVLGQVRTPGVYPLEKERYTIAEMIGQAQGINFYGDGERVKLIRDGKDYLIDLTNMDDINSNNVIVKDGDVIYVPTRKGEILDKKSPTLIPFASFITALAIIFSATK